MQMETEKPTQEYVERAMALSAEEARELAAKFDARFAKSRGYARLAPLERTALQLCYEEQALQQWRANISKLYQHHAG
jgi:hypothetical protein